MIRRVREKRIDTKSFNPVFKKPKKLLNQSFNNPLDNILYLQQTIGNQAVIQLLKSDRLPTYRPTGPWEQEDERSKVPEETEYQQNQAADFNLNREVLPGSEKLFIKPGFRLNTRDFFIQRKLVPGGVQQQQGSITGASKITLQNLFSLIQKVKTLEIVDVIHFILETYKLRINNVLIRSLRSERKKVKSGKSFSGRNKLVSSIWIFSKQVQRFIYDKRDITATKSSIIKIVALLKRLHKLQNTSPRTSTISKTLVNIKDQILRIIRSQKSRGDTVKREIIKRIIRLPVIRQNIYLRRFMRNPRKTTNSLIIMIRNQIRSKYKRQIRKRGWWWPSPGSIKIILSKIKQDIIKNIKGLPPGIQRQLGGQITRERIITIMNSIVKKVIIAQAPQSTKHRLTRIEKLRSKSKKYILGELNMPLNQQLIKYQLGLKLPGPQNKQLRVEAFNVLMNSKGPFIKAETIGSRKVKYYRTNYQGYENGIIKIIPRPRRIAVAWKNNNPGNVKRPSFIKTYGAIGKDKMHHAIFPDPLTGFTAMLALLNIIKRKTLEAGIRNWTFYEGKMRGFDKKIRKLKQDLIEVITFIRTVNKWRSQGFLIVCRKYPQADILKCGKGRTIRQIVRILRLSPQCISFIREIKYSLYKLLSTVPKRIKMRKKIRKIEKTKRKVMRNINNYIRDVSRLLGIHKSTSISQLSINQIADLAMGMMKNEGWSVGIIKRFVTIKGRDIEIP